MASRLPDEEQRERTAGLDEYPPSRLGWTQVLPAPRKDALLPQSYEALPTERMGLRWRAQEP